MNSRVEATSHRYHKKLRQLEAEHTPTAVSERLGQASNQKYLRDFVYGGIDGAVTSFAVVAGSVGMESRQGQMVTKTLVVVRHGNYGYRRHRRRLSLRGRVLLKSIGAGYCRRS